LRYSTFNVFKIGFPKRCGPHRRLKTCDGPRRCAGSSAGVNQESRRQNISVGELSKMMWTKTLGRQGANPATCKPVQTQVCTLSLGESCARSPRIAKWRGRTHRNPRGPLRSRSFRNHSREYRANRHQMRHPKSEQNLHVLASVLNSPKSLSISLKLPHCEEHFANRYLSMT
jgi:hypothetical protein